MRVNHYHAAYIFIYLFIQVATLQVSSNKHVFQAEWEPVWVLISWLLTCAVWSAPLLFALCKV